MEVSGELWGSVQHRWDKRAANCSFIFPFTAGFVDLQTENADLLENVGAIPFLDYKHFAAKIFFPEVQCSSTRQHGHESDSAGDVTLVTFLSRVSP